MRKVGRRMQAGSIVIGALCTLLMGSATDASAQVDRGTIQGLVTDQSGGVVQDAKVEVIQVATGSVTAISTNREGLYTAPNLALGEYQVVITKTGFAPAIGQGVHIRAGVQIRVDLVLQPVGVQETVSVTASNMDSSAITNSTALSEKMVKELPAVVSANKRDITGFLQNLPGFTGGTTFNPRANGASVGDTEVFVDGGRSGQLIQRGSLAEVGPSLEQVGEFSVVSNGFNAEYGGFGNWFSNVTIKSGTNKFSGSVFDHFGHDVLNAKSYFQTTKTPYQQHEGGFTLGGPVELPGYNGRNRTFFFSSLGLFYSRVGAGGGLVTVPTEAFKMGDFSGLVDGQGRQIPIYDPATTRPDGAGGFVRDQFPGNVIPADRISPAARKILSYLPKPDLPGNINNFRDRKAASWPYYNIYTPVAKVDHNLTASQKLSAMYTAQVRHRVLWGGGSGLGPAPEWGQPQTNPIDHVSDQIANSWKFRLNHDDVISSQMVNHLTLSLDRYVNRGQNKTNGQGWDEQLGIVGVPADDGAFPFVSFSGGTAAPVNLGRAYDEDWRDLSVALNENLTWTAGKHTMKYGAEFGLSGIDRFSTGNAPGSFTFSNFTTSQPNGGSAFSTQGNAFASFLLGEVYQASALIPVETRLRLKRYALFAQDEWRVSSALTVSYGLRWDYQPPFTEVNDQISSFVPDLTNPRAGGLRGALAFASTDSATYGRSFQDSWYGGIGPRLGLGYSINSKTIVRASAGVYYNGTGNQTSITPVGYTSTPTFTSANNFTPVFNWAIQPFPQSFSRPPALDPSFANGQAVSVNTADSGRLPDVKSWMVGLQREVAKGLTVDLSYIGTRSHHLALPPAASEQNYVALSNLSLGNLLLQSITSAAAVAAGYREPFPGFANQLGANTVAQALKPYPQYTSITSTAARLMEGRARYDSVQLKADKRFSRGLSLVSFVTWMKNESNTNYTLAYPGERPLRVDPGTPPLIFGASWTYELPFGRDRRFLGSASGLVSALVSGWQFSGSLRYQSGSALAITSANNLGPLGYTIKYADRVDGVDVYKDARSGFVPATDRYLNAAAFAVPASFALGNTGGPLSYVRGFTQKSEAFSFSKEARMGAGRRLVLGVDVTNPFNFVRWNDPNTNISSGSQFGSVTGTQGSRTAQVNVTYAF